MKSSEFAREILRHYGSYHNHKENMGYVAAALQISAGASFLFATPFWKMLGVYEFTLFFSFLVVCGLLGISYVWWQLGNRRDAAAWVAAALNTMSETDDRELSDTDLVHLSTGARLPRGLHREYTLWKSRIWRETIVPESIAYFLMTTIPVLGLWRICFCNT